VEGKDKDKTPGAGAGVKGPVFWSEATARSRASLLCGEERMCGDGLAGAGGRRTRGQLERQPWDSGLGPLGRARLQDRGRLRSRSRVWGDQGRKGALGGRTGFPNSGREARRPLPAASPASEAGAGLARHLLRIDAAATAASRASPAPGMRRRRRRRRRRAGPCLERGRARWPPSSVYPPRASSPDPAGSRDGDPVAAWSCWELELDGL
jgi:hypothetical protein